MGLAITAGTDTTLIVGGALCAPGIQPPLGPTAIRIAGGKIAAIEPVDPGQLDSTTAGLVALPTTDWNAGFRLWRSSRGPTPT